MTSSTLMTTRSGGTPYGPSHTAGPDADRALSDEEERWFVKDAPDPAPSYLSARSHRYEVAELDSLCRALAEGRHNRDIAHRD